MSAALQFSFNFKMVTCCVETCGITFAFEQTIYNRRLEDHSYFYCPNGHRQFFIDKTDKEKEIDRLKTQLSWSNEAKDRYWKSLEAEKRSSAAQKGVVTKLKKRVGNGICPCCNRQFNNLRNHMAYKHPEFKKEEK